MIHFTQLTAVTTALLLGATAGFAEGTLVEGQLSVGSDLTYPPYNYFAEGNVPAGFDVELMESGRY